MNIHPSIKVRIGDVFLFAPGVVVVQLNDNHEIDLEDVKEQIEAAHRLANGENFVAIIDGGSTLDITDRAMSFAAKYQSKNWVAFAIIVRSIAERLFANYYLNFKRPNRPTKVFTTPKGAQKWLSDFIKIEKELDYDL